MQQLKDVYGESADKIIQGNASNIVFLKSTDDAMIDTLSKMSGTTHKTYTDSKNVTQDLKRKYGKTEGTLTYSSTTVEKPVISYNDLAFIPLRNSIVFRAGDSPIWNRNETAFPMSYMLFARTVSNLGHKFTPLTLPSTSTVKDFDLRKNQPDFMKMFYKRLDQAMMVEECREKYKKAYGYDDHDILMLDPDVLSDELMDLVRAMLIPEFSETSDMDEAFFEQQSNSCDRPDGEEFLISENKEFTDAHAQYMAKRKALEDRVYIEDVLSASDLVNDMGQCLTIQYETEFCQAYGESISGFRNDRRFIVNAQGELYSNENVPLIRLNKDISEDAKKLQQAAEDKNSNTYAENKEDIKKIAGQSKYKIEKRFIEYLCEFDNWNNIAGGAFLRELQKYLVRD